MPHYATLPRKLLVVRVIFPNRKPAMSIRRRLLRSRALRRAEVIGICRFSYPALGGFQRVHDSIEDRTAFLYADARLDERFRLFEAFTLPSLRAQTDQDFKFLIVIGENFPADRLAQLRALTDDIPQVVIQAHPPKRHRTVMAEAINSVRQKGRYSLQFRLDDDDAVGVGFVAALRRSLRQCHGVFPENHLMAIDFVNGYNARAGLTGIEAEASQRLFVSAGLAIAFRPGSHLTVMNFGHHEVWRHMPVLTRLDADMWIRGANDHNDSGEDIARHVVPLTPEEEAKFGQAFGVSAAAVRAIWRGGPGSG